MKYGFPAHVARTWRIAWVAMAVASGLGAPAARAADPQQTTATYDDWLMLCQARQEPAAAAPADKAKAAAPAAKGPKRLCEITQTFTIRETGGTLAKLAIGRLPDKDEIKAILLTPVGVYLPDGAILKIADSPDVKGPFVTCGRDACSSELVLTKAATDQMKSGSKKVSLVFTAGDRSPVTINVSTKGLAAALDAALAQTQ